MIKISLFFIIFIYEMEEINIINSVRDEDSVVKLILSNGVQSVHRGPIYLHCNYPTVFFEVKGRRLEFIFDFPILE